MAFIRAHWCSCIVNRRSFGGAAAVEERFQQTKPSVISKDTKCEARGVDVEACGARIGCASCWKSFSCRFATSPQDASCNPEFSQTGYRALRLWSHAGSEQILRDSNWL